LLALAVSVYARYSPFLHVSGTAVTLVVEVFAVNHSAPVKAPMSLLGWAAFVIAVVLKPRAVAVAALVMVEGKPHSDTLGRPAATVAEP